MGIDMAQVDQENARRQAALDQRTAILVGHIKANPGTVVTLQAVMADWDTLGARSALAKYPKEVHDWVRELTDWAFTYLAIQAINHGIEDAKSGAPE